ncbi:uncharacterized protein LOC134277381 [Saccostrea cucullata]|uniref:uncharacterized protein LOC134277381 n=1 Tax=Saccostrea cuccullata TaxID=36930 RepID=UPI002ED0C319
MERSILFNNMEENSVPLHFNMHYPSSDEEIVLTQQKYKSPNPSESEYDTDNLVSDILGLEKVHRDAQKSATYAPQCSDISDDELAQSYEKVEKVPQISERRFSIPKSDKEIEELKTKQFAPATKAKIRWAVNTFGEWQRSRNETSKTR